MYVVPLVNPVVPSESVATCWATPEVVTTTHPAAPEAGHPEPWVVHVIFSVVPEFPDGGAVPVTETWFFTVPGEAATVGLLRTTGGSGVGIGVGFGVGFGVGLGMGLGTGDAVGAGNGTGSAPGNSKPSRGVPSGTSADAVDTLSTCTFSPNPEDPPLSPSGLVR